MSFDKLFDYPFDSQDLLTKHKRIKRRLLEKADNFDEKRIAVLGGSTTFHVVNVLELFLLSKGIKPVFYESEYNRYFEDSVYGYEKLVEFKPDIALVHTTNRNIQHMPNLEDTEGVVDEKSGRELSRYRQIWDSLINNCQCAIIQNNFELPRNREIGNLDFTLPCGKTNFIMKLNLAFAAEARKIPNLYINDINYLSSWFGLDKWHDVRIWHTSKYALNLDAIPLLAHNITGIICGIYGKTKKVLVLDLDNTLWGGVIGDDGAEGIEIGNETPIAEVYSELQKYVKNLKKRGIVLAVCSKNDLSNAKEGFERVESVLKLDDFQVFKANWQPKTDNIEQIAGEINVGLDSLVFIDDNPAEREIVKSRLPVVNVPDIGSNVEDFIDHIDKGGWFEPISLSSDDLERNRYYEDNKKRDTLKNDCVNMDDFLRSLAMEAEIGPFTDMHVSRITQLINKTNQFNLTTQRYNVAEVEKMASDPGYITLYGKLADKFGDNGLISVLIGKVQDKTVDILVWLMSCRVLQRGFEYAMLDILIKECRQRGIETIEGTYIQSRKNGMVRDHYEKMGFSLLETRDEVYSKWVYVIDDNSGKTNKFIKVMTK